MYRHGGKPYAIVTGATDGIGKALAFELARNNFNVVIHGRNPEKLNKVQREIIDVYPTVDVRIAILDAAKIPHPNAVIDVVKELHVTILINCLGIVGDGAYKPFEEEMDDSIQAMMNANALFPTLLTRHLLPQLRQAAPSLILNLSSGAAIANPPFLAPYAGSKAYNLAFSHALFNEMEYLKTNVHVLVVLIGNVNSAANKSPVSLFCPSSIDYAKTLLERVNQKGPVITGNWQHALQIKFVELMPYWIIDYLLMRMTHKRTIENSKEK
jgi:short-subunit dehydrogenase